MVVQVKLIRVVTLKSIIMIIASTYTYTPLQTLTFFDVPFQVNFDRGWCLRYKLYNTCNIDATYMYIHTIIFVSLK